MMREAIILSTETLAAVRRAAVGVMCALVPVFGLSGCSGQESAKIDGPAEQVAKGSGAPSIDGPALATPGLWRTTTTVEGRPVLGALLACVDEASQKASSLDAPVEAGCRKPAQRPIPGGYAYDLVCEQDGLTTTVAGEIKGDSRRVTMSSTTRMAGPEGELMPVTRSVTEHVYVGPCPADMKPGDSVQAP